MKHLDLFSGIGGFALAASWVWGVEHEVVSFCEVEPFAQKVLKKHWPEVPVHDDISTFNCDNLQNIGLLTGGFPCQDISLSGKGEGLNGKRSGLWFEMFRIIRTIRPRFVIIENSSALLVRGGGRVIADLASIRFDAQWQVVTAKEVGAPHLRKRLCIVAYPNKIYGEAGLGNLFERAAKVCRKSAERRAQFWVQTPCPNNRMDDGVPGKLYELAVGAYGNAITPQAFTPIMQAIKDLEGQHRFSLDLQAGL